MNPRAKELVTRLQLAPHPEGGFYRETFRSRLRVLASNRPPRDALTTIFYLLAAGSYGAWHRVQADEVWHWFEGEPLELLMAAPDFSAIHCQQLGPVAAETSPVATVPAGWWQAARPLGSFALCGCTVAPGFEFEDFSFLRDVPVASQALLVRAPELARLL